eukprot:14814185-Ditylum_brightwellii.AAC.1
MDDDEDEDMENDWEDDMTTSNESAGMLEVNGVVPEVNGAEDINYEKMTVAELKDILRSRGLK